MCYNDLSFPNSVDFKSRIFNTITSLHWTFCYVCDLTVGAVTPSWKTVYNFLLQYFIAKIPTKFLNVCDRIMQLPQTSNHKLPMWVYCEKRVQAAEYWHFLNWPSIIGLPTDLLVTESDIVDADHVFM